MSGRLHHVSLTCASLTASIAFYRQFGFSVEQAFQDEHCSITLLYNQHSRIELFSFKGNPLPSQIPEELIYLKSIGIRHFAIEVDDLTAMHSTLSTTTKVTPITPARLGSFHYFFCYDPDGNQIEILKTHQNMKGIT